MPPTSEHFKCEGLERAGLTTAVCVVVLLTIVPSFILAWPPIKHEKEIIWTDVQAMLIIFFDQIVLY